MLRDGFTMNDMLEQMRMLKKMGGMKSILGMLPGGQRMLNQMGGNIDDSVFDKIEAMIQSMTKQERVKPSIINGQRRARIARGSGTTPADVNNLMKQWGEMNKMMGKMAARRGRKASAARRCACLAFLEWATWVRSAAWAATRLPAWAAAPATPTWICFALWSSR